MTLQSNSLFVTGTDTDVGKTVVTALLALHFQERGLDVGIMKPFATACVRVDGRLESADARWLREIVGVEDELELINPARWEQPLAPLVASRRAGDEVQNWIERCVQSYEILRSRHDYMIVEGIGGLLVPLPDSFDDAGETVPTGADLVEALGLPVVIVSRRGLGAINHALLTARYPLRPPSRFAGLVFCDAHPIEENIAAQTNVEIIAELCDLPVWGIVPHLPDLSRAALLNAARALRMTF